MMRIPRKTTRGAAWTMAVGAAAGVAAAALWTVRARGWPRRSRRMRGGLTLEERVVNALLADEATSRCAIEVAAIQTGRGGCRRSGAMDRSCAWLAAALTQDARRPHTRGSGRERAARG